MLRGNEGAAFFPSFVSFRIFYFVVRNKALVQIVRNRHIVLAPLLKIQNQFDSWESFAFSSAMNVLSCQGLSTMSMSLRCSLICTVVIRFFRKFLMISLVVVEIPLNFGLSSWWLCGDVVWYRLTSEQSSARTSFAIDWHLLLVRTVALLQR